MKLRQKLIMLSIIPLVIVAVCICVLAKSRTTKYMEELITDNLQAVAVLAENGTESLSGTNFYHIDGDSLWNMNLNITENVDFYKSIKSSTGIDISIYFGDTVYCTTIDGQMGTKATPQSITNCLDTGSQYFSSNVTINGNDYFGYYVPFGNGGNNTICGMVFAGMQKTSVVRNVNSIVQLIIVISIAAVILAGIFIWFTANKITSNISKSVSILSEVADGNLAVDVDKKLVKSKDETGSMARAVESLRDKLITVVGDIANKSNNVLERASSLGEAANESSIAVDQVEQAVQDIADGASMQAGDTQKATENVLEIGNMLEQTGANVESLKANAADMLESGAVAINTLRELESINAKTTETIGIIYDQTSATHASVQEIGSAVNLITDIADETNLLSLNASIEAARAGEAGRGFAVVASQIQKLAEQSNESAQQIERIIDSLVADSQKTIAAMTEAKAIMEKQNEIVERTNENFDKVMSGIEDAKENINRIDENTKNLDVSRAQVIELVQNLASIADQNASSTTQTSASATQVSATISNMSSDAQQLQSISEELRESVSIFRL